MKTLPRLLGYFGRYKWRAVGALAAMGLVSAATVALLFLLKKVIDEVLGAGAAGTIVGMGAGASSRTAPLLAGLESGYAAGLDAARAAGLGTRYAVPLLLVAALLVKNVFTYLSEVALNSIGLAMVRDLRQDAYRALLDQSTRYSSESSSGELMSRLLSDAEQIQSAFGSRMADFVQGSLTMVLVLVYVFSLNFQLALAVLVVAPLLIVPIVGNFRKLRRTGLSARERIGEMGGILGETLRGHRLIKTYAMEDFEAERFGEANRRYFGASRQTMRLQALNSPLMEILAGAGLALVFVYAAGQIRAGQMTVGGLVSFLAAIMMLYKPLKDVTRTNIVLQVALVAAQRLFDVVDGENDIVEKPGARDLAPFSKSVRYEGVAFGYGADAVLEGLELTIARGETVALVGPSGAGKTTLVNLLPRLYDPLEGRVTFDGVDLRDATLKSLRRQIGLVTQETVLFDTSVRENIAYGERAPSEVRVRAAARAAFADEFIERLPQGYDSGVGEGGGRLSGGQRQRLAIARAIYKDAPILILDEATSQLDAESEALVARGLANLMQGRTTLVIAHRLSTVRRADRIVVLDEGRIVEEGTHAALLTRRGLYRRLHDMQYFAENEPAPAAPPEVP
ncbi:MAG TPA: ABC transporter ATP-binding protein [Thermoanaerobaculia bacterium]|nr:ABC transporter ATP-binding protein [Thermoanaerobaculia bacterium]